MYYLVYGPLYLLSLLPLKVLYLFSDLAYLLIYHVVGYRKEVVRQNLAIAFPQKTEAERIAIAKKFYQNFTDNFIEIIKGLSASNHFFRQHFKADVSVLKYLESKGHQRIQLHTGHNFNWEYANLGVPLHINYPLLTVYMPVTAGAFNQLLLRMRARTGAKLLSALNIRNELLRYRHQRYALVLVADQNPGDPRNAFWVNFFNRPTPFLRAPENGARRGNLPVVFCQIIREKRGHYRVHFHLADEAPGSLKVGALTNQYAAFLQDAIEQQPDNWLWSHRRWKWEWKEEYGKVMA